MKYNTFLLLFLISCSTQVEPNNQYYWQFYYIIQDDNHKITIDKAYKFSNEMKDTLKEILSQSGINWAVDKRDNIFVPSHVDYSRMHLSYRLLNNVLDQPKLKMKDMNGRVMYQTYGFMFLKI